MQDRAEICQVRPSFVKAFAQNSRQDHIPTRVTSVYKSGVTTELGNYRPIAIVSPFSKVLERLIYNQIFAFLEKEKILFDYQFGFRKGHSTEHAILETIENLKAAIDENKRHVLKHGTLIRNSPEHLRNTSGTAQNSKGYL
jgi:hypothetical protein